MLPILAEVMDLVHFSEPLMKEYVENIALSEIVLVNVLYESVNFFWLFHNLVNLREYC